MIGSFILVAMVHQVQNLNFDCPSFWFISSELTFKLNFCFWFMVTATILSDMQLTAEMLKQLDLNVIFLGGPTENRWVYKLMNTLPGIQVNKKLSNKTKQNNKQFSETLIKIFLVTYNKTSFSLGGHDYSAPGLGLLFLAPLTINNNLALIICGTDILGFRLASKYVPYISGLTLPDYCTLLLFQRLENQSSESTNQRFCVKML
jgi:hypothetical protein